MSQWLSQHGYLIIVFVVLLIAFVFLFFKAAKAYSGHNKAVREQTGELKRLTALKEKYRNASREDLDSFPPEEILEGTALLYQIALQKSEDMEKDFLSMAKQQKLVYVLDVFISDASAGEFYSQNGEIITSLIGEALTEIGMEDFAAELTEFAKMFDKDDETVSYSQSAISEFDKSMENKGVLSKIKLNSAKYIKDNFNIIKN